MPKYYRPPRPWDPGYALPKNVVAEGIGRGTITTAQLPRKTFSGQVPWNAGYALPDYVSNEFWGRGAVTTGYLPRGMGDDWSYSDPLVFSPQADVFSAYGRSLAEGIVSKVVALPAKQQRPTLNEILKRLDKSLPARVWALCAQYKKAGNSEKQSLIYAIAALTSKGFKQELVTYSGNLSSPEGRSSLGATAVITGFVAPQAATPDLTSPDFNYNIWQSIKQKLEGKNPTASDMVKNSQLKPRGIDINKPASDKKYWADLQAKHLNTFVLFGDTIDLNKYFMKYMGAWTEKPMGAQRGIYHMADAIIKNPSAAYTSGKSAIPSALKTKLKSHNIDISKKEKSYWQGIKDKFYSPSLGKQIEAGVGAVYDAGKAVVDASIGLVKDLGCKIVGSDAGVVAAAAYGGEAGAQGAVAARGALCSGGGPVQEFIPPPPQSAGMPGWVLPAGIAAGALVLVLATKKGKK